MQFSLYHDVFLMCVVLLHFLTACNSAVKESSATQSQYLNEQSVIELAKLYCGQLHSPPKEVEHNIEAKFLACKDVPEKTGWNACDTSVNLPDTMVWVVSMDGLWFHYGPPGPNGVESEPIPFIECNVIMDANSGALIELGSK